MCHIVHAPPHATAPQHHADTAVGDEMFETLLRSHRLAPRAVR